jgi:hypothetical protein
MLGIVAGLSLLMLVVVCVSWASDREDKAKDVKSLELALEDEIAARQLISVTSDENGKEAIRYQKMFREQKIEAHKIQDQLESAKQSLTASRDQATQFEGERNELQNGFDNLLAINANLRAEVVKKKTPSSPSYSRSRKGLKSLSKKPAKRTIKRRSS